MRNYLISTLVLFLLATASAFAQPITGIWRGKVTKGNPPFATTYKVEVKIIRQGDSLTGTSYYFANPTNYYRYSIKGYLDPVDASLHWWDEVLLEKKGGTAIISNINQQPLAMQADFNCPGSGIMKLDGAAETKNGDDMEVHLDKYETPVFSDGWDELIENWLYGGSHPDLIATAEEQQREMRNGPPIKADENPIAKVENNPPPAPPPAKTIPATPAPEKPAPTASANPAPVVIEKPVPAPPPPPPSPLTTQEKFESRQRLVQTTLPIAGDSIELQFFDNAEIDGDSISLFLNGKLIFEHVKLSAQPFILKLAVADLSATTELAMVAENLGSIPPNTAFMMAYVNGERYTARLVSTEKTTAIIRFQQSP